MCQLIFYVCVERGLENECLSFSMGNGKWKHNYTLVMISLPFSLPGGASQVKWNKVTNNLFATAHEGDVRIWDPRVRFYYFRSLIQKCLEYFAGSPIFFEASGFALMFGFHNTCIIMQIKIKLVLGSNPKSNVGIIK